MRNAFFAEPGMMLTCMLTSDNRNVRKKAVKKIQSLTQEKPTKASKGKTVSRNQEVSSPSPSVECQQLGNIIDWNKIEVHEPFILEKKTDEEICAAVKDPLEFPPYSLHSQSVERAVKLVSTSTQNVCGAENRHANCL